MNYSILFFIFLFGLCWGSFINCLIWRLHKNEGIWPRQFGGRGKGRSYCPKCRQQIAWYDNIPVLSFLMLGGRCRHCRKGISFQYPLVELIAGALFVLAVICNLKLVIWDNGITANSIIQITNYKLQITIFRDWLIIVVMIVIFIYDLRWYLILDAVTLPAAGVLFALNLFLGFSWLNLIICGIIGASFFLIQFIISRGKWIGGGDIRLGLLMGLALGKLDLLALAIVLAYFMGSIVGIGLMIAGKKKWGSKLPLGVFLSTATIIVLFCGKGILGWYLGLF